MNPDLKKVLPTELTVAVRAAAAYTGTVARPSISSPYGSAVGLCFCFHLGMCIRSCFGRLLWKRVSGRPAVLQQDAVSL
ncbi:hypothetical protein EYF80_058808 [Liparis tanakae]|uniref:Uncharacterized protein n=1 Tax=Liparis tanakae TaxID=230148 RepID=A0A4Z2ER05_9TELE|nr:hypothetical protein EYF80_058808 [Liparis tanakae]